MQPAYEKTTVIETQRLILRTWNAEDIERYYQINQDPRVTEYLLFAPTIHQATDFIHKMNEQYNKLNYTLFAAIEKESHNLIGFIGLNSPSWESHFTPCVEIGWRLESKFWGKGYATEGAMAVLDYGFNQCGLNEIVALTVPQNIRSIKVMQKLGMTYKASDDFNHPLVPLNNKLLKHVLYRIERVNYLKNNKNSNQL